MSHLRKRGKVWYLYWRENGILYGKRLSTDKFTALEYKQRFDDNLYRKKLGLPLKSYSWKTFIEEYLNWAKTNKAKRTIKRDIFTLKCFNKMFNISKTEEFTRDLLEKYKAKRLEKGLSIVSINRELNTLKAIGKKLEEWGYLSTNPVKNVKWFPMKRMHKVRYLTQEEIKKLLKISYGVWKIAIMISLYTGTRRGEVCHLQWEDIDFDKKILTIQAHKEDNWHPKDYEIRTIPLHPVLYRYLLKIKKNINNSKYIVPVDEDVLTTMTKKIFTKAGIKNASFHTLRHTFASYLAMSGVDLYTVSKLLGHASIETTQIYAHLQPDYLKNSILKLKY
ncbi:MAG: tyrosine-type recombinase/integrase [Candidatus Omnitrophica bacterium]|nr:tyrosine-type recombinase/integrase [Candidatus Omnitrophota bacterium]